MNKNIDSLINFYKEQISDHISEVKQYQVSKELKRFASLFTPGKFYYYVINFQNLAMDFVSSGTKDVLGIEPSDFTVNELLNRIHPEDLEAMKKKEALAADFLLNFLSGDESTQYKVIYFFRILGRNNKYKKILHQTTVLSVAESGKLHHVLGIHTDVTHYPILFNNYISLISLEHEKSYYNLDPNISTTFTDLINEQNTVTDLCSSLTSKEKQIVAYLVKGYSSKEIASELNISFETVRTHRKNILRKTMCKNRAELISRCIIEGTI